MARLAAVVGSMLLTGSISAMAVESEADRPLNLAQRWQFYRTPAVYFQHLCSADRAKKVQEIITATIERNAEILGELTLEEPLQVRLYSSAENYRKVMRFSQERNGHYNGRLNMLVSHCGVSKNNLEQLTTLYFLKAAQLRPWQRIFIAEHLPAINQVSRTAGSVTPLPVYPRFLRVMLSNHVPAQHEREILRLFARSLAKQGLLRHFMTGLVHMSIWDDTGLDLLDSLVPGAAEEMLSGVDKAEKRSNNTLRNRR